MSIFISIASYCDPVLPFTVARALATASRPQDLHFGIVEQATPDYPRMTASAVAPARLSYTRVDAQDSRGPCWARALAMALYEGEDWFFQIDSHMDFDDGWDQTLVSAALALEPGRRGVVLSAYPNAFVFQNGEPIKQPSTDKVIVHVV